MARDVHGDAVGLQGKHRTGGEDGVEIAVFFEVVVLLYARFIDEVHGFFELVFDKLIIGREREEQRMEQVDMGAVFGGRLSCISVCTACKGTPLFKM
jgi:hypothetical protein